MKWLKDPGRCGSNVRKIFFEGLAALFADLTNTSQRIREEALLDSFVFSFEEVGALPEKGKTGWELKMTRLRGGCVGAP